MNLYTYTDAYLKGRITEDIESRAIEEVDAIRLFPETPVDWRGKLIVLRAYILACLEQSAAADDVFAAKLKAYKLEWESTLAQATTAANAVKDADYKPVLSISLERG
jgi:hypothetical protein